MDCLVGLVNVFKLRRDKRFVFCLSGDFRALILEVLLAASFLGLDGDVEVEFEDSSFIFFPLRWCGPIVLDDVEKKVLSGVRDDLILFLVLLKSLI